MRAWNCWNSWARPGDGTSPLGCMQCGLCAASCPLGYAMEFPPRKLILQAAAGNLDKVLASPSLWMCVGCYTCSHRCPRDIELTDGLWPALRDRAMQAGFQPPAELQETFQNLFKYGNTLGKSPRQRLDWAKGLDVPVLDLSKDRRPVEVLWLVGCYPSYYPRNHVVTRAFARILTKLGVTLGRARRQGEGGRRMRPDVRRGGAVRDAGRGEPQALQPAAIRQDRGPGSARLSGAAAFYPRFGAWYPVQHYTMFLAERLEQLQAAGGQAARGDGDLSRQLLRGPAVRLLRSAAVAAAADPRREAGGDGPSSRQTPCAAAAAAAGCGSTATSWPTAATVCPTNGSARRPTTGADTLAVSCPYELSRFEDAAKVAGLEGRLKVRDIIELLAESMDLGERSVS